MILTQDLAIPVIAIDGGSGTGKGTARNYVARALNFNQLDSGLLYRSVAILAKRFHIEPHDESALEQIANMIFIEIFDEAIFVQGIECSKFIRSLEIGLLSSQIAIHASVRTALKKYELNMRKPPGLVADGRDMAKIFDTPYRFFIETDIEERARRRVMQQLKEHDVIVDYAQVLAELQERDHIDKTRDVSPLLPHPDAFIINNTTFSDSSDTGKEILRIYHQMIN